MKRDEHTTHELSELEAQIIPADDAEARARAVAEHSGEYPTGAVDALLARVSAGENVSSECFERPVLEAAARLEQSEPLAFEELARALRETGVKITPWKQAVRSAAREIEKRRRADLEAQARDEQSRLAAERERAELEAARARDEEERARRARIESDPILAPFFAVYELDGRRYELSPERGLVVISPAAKGPPKVESITPRFAMRFVGEVLHRDLPNETPRRIIQVALRWIETGDVVTRELTPKQLEEPGWLTEAFGAGAAVAPGRAARDHLRFFLSATTMPRRVERFGCTGWVRFEGEDVFVDARGAIGANGRSERVTTDLPRELARIELEESADARPGLAALLELVNAAPVLAAACARAVLGESSLILHITGAPEAGKSYLAGLAMACFGRAFQYNTAQIEWGRATTASSWYLFERAGNVPLWLDDLRFGNGRADEKTALAADELLRSHFNRSAPGRMTRDGGRRSHAPSRCVVFSTGEACPQGHSLRGRILPMFIEQRDSRWSLLREKANRGLLAQGMFAFVVWLAGRGARWRSDLERREREAQRSVRIDGSRASATVAQLVAGLDALLACAIEHDVVTRDDALLARAESIAALSETARQREVSAQEENPVRRFFELLRAEITAGRAHIKSTRAGHQPHDAEALGWTPERVGSPDGAMWRPNGVCIGWRKPSEPEVIFLDETTAYTEAKRAAQRDGHPLGIATTRDLGALLFKDGALVRTEREIRDTYTYRVTACGARRSAFVVSVEAFGLDQAGAPADWTGGRSSHESE